MAGIRLHWLVNMQEISGIKFDTCPNLGDISFLIAPDWLQGLLVPFSLPICTQFAIQKLTENISFVSSFLAFPHMLHDLVCIFYVYTFSSYNHKIPGQRELRAGWNFLYWVGKSRTTTAHMSQRWHIRWSLFLLTYNPSFAFCYSDEWNIHIWLKHHDTKPNSMIWAVFKVSSRTHVCLSTHAFNIHLLQNVIMKDYRRFLTMYSIFSTAKPGYTCINHFVTVWYSV